MATNAIRNIGLDLGWNERYDFKVAIGIIKFSRGRGDWRLFGNNWLFRQRHPDTPKPDGIIARITNREDLRRIRAHRVPVVDIANAYPDADLPQAMNDEAATGRMAGRHLLDRCFPRLAYVGIDETFWSNQRAHGLSELLRETGGPELLRFSVGVSWLKREHGLSGLAAWLGRLPLPCGVVAANDLLGSRVTLAASMAGLSIPDEIGVVGVDNEDVFCELSQPALTSIACDCESIGMEAANLLARILAGEAHERRVEVRPLGIVARESTNIVVGEDRLVREVKNFIANNVEKGINVADVASAFPLSRRALEKRFRRDGGATIHGEILAARLERAEKLLLSGRTAAEACRESGFQSLRHFYHAFGKRFGMAPVRYAESRMEARDGNGGNP